VLDPHKPHFPDLFLNELLIGRIPLYSTQRERLFSIFCLSIQKPKGSHSLRERYAVRTYIYISGSITFWGAYKRHPDGVS
jgi:hypothetical protein